MDNRLRLRHLRCFLETARLESLSAAAATLNISQPAASKTIRELEEILGVELFDRSGRRLRLTAAGRQYQQGVAAAMAGLARAQTQARRTPAVKTRLAIGVLPTASSEIFPHAALRFHDTVPDCILRVITGPNWMLLSQLREGAIDMMVGRMPAPDQMTGLAFEQLYVEDVVAVVRPDHPLCRAAPDPMLFGEYPLMLPPAGAVINATVRAYFQSIGLRHVEPAFENVSLAFGRKVVALSDTVWFISRGVVAEEIAGGRLAVLDAGTTVLAGPVGMSFRESTAQGAELRTLMALLRDAAVTMR